MRTFALTLGRLVLAGALVVAIAACGDAQAGQPSSPAGSPGAPAPAADVVSITARDLHFTEARVVAPANRPFQISFDNEDGAPHNVAVYRDSSAAEKISVGEIFGGPGTRTQDVPALAPGEYFFRCDVHPDMTATLVVQ